MEIAEGDTLAGLVIEKIPKRLSATALYYVRALCCGCQYSIRRDSLLRRINQGVTLCSACSKRRQVRNRMTKKPIQRATFEGAEGVLRALILMKGVKTNENRHFRKRVGT